jgi:twinkle protein
MSLLDQAKRSIERTDASVARIDAARARKVGNMLVTGATEMQEPECILMDVAKQDATQLLAAYHDIRSHYATAPFDVSGDKLRFYPGEVTIWSGYPGAGKSTVLRELTDHLLHTGNKVFTASFEEHPTDLLIHLAGTAYGREVPDAKQLQWFIDYYADSLWIWGTIGIAKHRQILGTVQALAQKGVTHAIIDSLMCLDIDNGNFELQRQFANLLAAVAASTNVHIHLVAHPRKLVSADQEPDINDVAGARELGGRLANIVFVRRGKSEMSIDGLTPMRLAIRKQRILGYVGDIVGWFNRSLRQFKVDQFDQRPTQYLPKQAYE